jgi:hypothetical protein
MASFLWTSVFIFLCLEIALTLILVIPVPRTFRNWICRETTKLDLKQKLKPALWGIGIALSVALFDCLSLLQFIFSMEEEMHERTVIYGAADAIQRRQMDREKEYKTERNIYLAGFALTLLFVIGRITDLMQEHVELEDELEKIRLSGKPAVESSSSTAAEDRSGASEIEMKPLGIKKND